jgi:hypothetical protein
MVFVHIGLAPVVSDVHSAAVACGMANRLGNKGGIGLSIKVADTRLVFVNTHLAAHQHDVTGRNAQICKLFVELPFLLMKKSSSSDWLSPTEAGSAPPAAKEEEAYEDDNVHHDSDDDDPEVVCGLGAGTGTGAIPGKKVMSERTANGELTPNLAEYSDRLVFMGDMNYRINGNRAIVDRLLAMNMLEVLMSNDQLR